MNLSELELKILRAAAGAVVRDIPYEDRQVIRDAITSLIDNKLIYFTFEDDQPTYFTTALGDEMLATTTHANGAPMFAPDGTLLDDKGERSIFDDVDA